uniref:Uncharacterized protein n=1 Tax=Ditylenchus dipsaci TaxID=166011 RepID=A0A915D8Q9_9BILA
MKKICKRLSVYENLNVAKQSSVPKINATKRNVNWWEIEVPSRSVGFIVYQNKNQQSRVRRELMKFLSDHRKEKWTRWVCPEDEVDDYIELHQSSQASIFSPASFDPNEHCHQRCEHVQGCFLPSPRLFFCDGSVAQSSECCVSRSICANVNDCESKLLKIIKKHWEGYGNLAYRGYRVHCACPGLHFHLLRGHLLYHSKGSSKSRNPGSAILFAVYGTGYSTATSATSGVGMQQRGP